MESPRWHAGRLWFADWIAGEIIALDDRGHAEVVVRHASLPLCFDFLPDGRLVLVSNERMALLTHEGGELVEYADLSALSPYGFNDIVVDARGNAYVNSGNFEFSAGPPDGPVQPGFVALVRPGAAPQVVADDIAFPNGMAVTADNATLVVADSYRHHLAGWEIAPNGSLSGRRIWADLGDAAPDGICLDADGAAWYADVPHQVCVRVAESGAVLETVHLDRGGFACMLSRGPEPSLFVTAARWPGMAGLAGHAQWHGQVVRVPVAVPGAGWPGS